MLTNAGGVKDGEDSFTKATQKKKKKKGYMLHVIRIRMRVGLDYSLGGRALKNIQAMHVLLSIGGFCLTTLALRRRLKSVKGTSYG